MILAFFTGLIYFYFPETKNLTMEEIAVIFDGEQAIGIMHNVFVDHDGVKGSSTQHIDDVHRDATVL